MDFPQLRNRAGALVVLYTQAAGAERPLHGAYLAKAQDKNVWVPCAWTDEGYLLSKEKQTDLDIVETLKVWRDKKKAEQVAKEEEQKADSVS